MSATAARAEREALSGGVVVDWGAGAVEAPGIAAADLRAPSAEVARIKAERQARERAQSRLSLALKGLPRSRWDGAPPAAEVLSQALAGAEAQDVDYGANGSVSLHLRLPLATLPTPLLQKGQRARPRPAGAPAPEKKERPRKPEEKPKDKPKDKPKESSDERAADPGEAP